MTDSTQSCCAVHDHEWDEGDNDAIYCGVCNGYACDVCAATGHASNDSGGNRKCFMCSGYGVVMWWEPEQRWISPPNYFAALAREETVMDERRGCDDGTGLGDWQLRVDGLEQSQRRLMGENDGLIEDLRRVLAERDEAFALLRVAMGPAKDRDEWFGRRKGLLDGEQEGNDR